MKAKDVFKNEFLTNLGTDHVAVDARGMPYSRAGNREAVVRAAPDAAAYFTGEDFDPVSVSVPAPPAIPIPVPSAPAAPPVTPTEEPVFVMPIGDLPDTPKPDWSSEPVYTGTGTPPVSGHFGQAPIKPMASENPHVTDPMLVTAPKAPLN